jgi:hypothetical protein
MVGPNAKLSIQGQEEHDIGSFSWDINKEKTPFIPLNKDVADRYTTGPAAYTFTAEVQSKADGSTAIDWDSWCKNDEIHPVVVRPGAQTLRCIMVVVDTVGGAIEREAGTYTKSISGKFADYQWS